MVPQCRSPVCHLRGDVQLDQVLAPLLTETASCAHPAILDCKAVHYAATKEFLLKAFSPTKWVHTERILATNNPGDCRPSQLADFLQSTLSDMDLMTLVCHVLM